MLAPIPEGKADLVPHLVSTSEQILLPWLPFMLYLDAAQQALPAGTAD